MTSLTRPNLSLEIARKIRDLVVRGELPAGQRINEVHLAQSLGTSRTPLREALTMLVAEGFLLSEPRRGVFAPSLTRREVDDLYPLRALLDPEALRQSGFPSASRSKRLRELNRRMAAGVSDPARLIDLDDEWHLLLVEGCSNEILLGMIRQIIRRSRRYEYAYMSETGNVTVATAEHDLILDALERENLDEACEGLRTNMSSARGPLLDWLHSREDEG